MPRIMQAMTTPTAQPQMVTGFDMYEHVNGRKCRVVDYTRLPQDKFKCVHLSVEKKPFICLYDSAAQDYYVSGSILNGGLWESGNVGVIVTALQQDPTLAFIDIGSNVGQFSLVAAAMGRKVLAVEALGVHARMLARASIMNSYQNQIKIVHNALSNSYRTVSLVTHPGNMGMTRIKTNQGNDFIAAAEGVPTILADDLASVAHFERAIMKIDIEGQEVPALSHCSQLFDQVDIPFIFMEWWGGSEHLYTSAEDVAMVQQLFAFFNTRGYKVYNTGKKPLSLDQWNTWPFEVLWIRNQPKLPRKIPTSTEIPTHLRNLQAGGW